MTADAPTILDQLTLAFDASSELGQRLATRLVELGAAVAAPGAAGDAVDGVVHVAAVDRAGDRLLVDTDRDAWDREAEAPIRAALAALQASYARLEGRGGSVVLVVPSIALTGAAGLVAFASAAEGIRLLGKAAARAWGKHGIRVNCVTAPVEEWGIVQSTDHAVPNKHGPALGERDVVADVAGAIASLCGPLAAGITGTTIGVDRGAVLAP